MSLTRYCGTGSERSKSVFTDVLGVTQLCRPATTPRTSHCAAAARSSSCQLSSCGDGRKSRLCAHLICKSVHFVEWLSGRGEQTRWVGGGDDRVVWCAAKFLKFLIGAVVKFEFWAKFARAECMRTDVFGFLDFRNFWNFRNIFYFRHFSDQFRKCCFGISAVFSIF
jgi:hypothetical protein